MGVLSLHHLKIATQRVFVGEWTEKPFVCMNIIVVLKKLYHVDILAKISLVVLFNDAVR